ncbi:hypothetical protein BJF79_11560 [Actinomadura sp. CNU-125]|nr:hypothetical protein BJF79_11560 [Actinomadura sp. CNU-125]
MLPLGLVPLFGLVDAWWALALLVLAAATWVVVLCVVRHRSTFVLRYDLRVVLASTLITVGAGQAAMAFGGFGVCIAASIISTLSILVLALHHRWLPTSARQSRR